MTSVKTYVSRSPEKLYYAALVSIAQILGTGRCNANKCEGCQYELEQAAFEARKAIGWLPKGRKRHKPQGR